MQNQSPEIESSNSFQNDEAIWAYLAFDGMAQHGSVDDLLENWLESPMGGTTDPGVLQADPSQSSSQMANDISGLPLTTPDISAPQLSIVPDDGGTMSGNNTSTDAATPEKPTQSAKIGTRFTPDITKILRRWFLTHSHHPYPKEDDIKILQTQTWLTKSQILTWFANARRRGSMTRSNNSLPRPSQGRDVPFRPGTPLSRDTSSLNPLERWVESPPETEPAPVTAIARAVASSPPGCTVTHSRAYQQSSLLTSWTSIKLEPYWEIFKK